MMEVLFATPVPPLLTKPRPHYFIRGLVRRGHVVHLLTQVPSDSPHVVEELAEAPGWREILESCATVTTVAVPKLRSYAQCAMSLPTRTPLRVAYCQSPAFTAKARDLVRVHGCDVLHVDRTRIAPSLTDLPLPKVLDATDSMALYTRRTMRYGRLPERLVSLVEFLKEPSFETAVCGEFSACLATTAEDARALETPFGLGRLEVLPNGVDDRFFACDPHSEPDTLVFVGTMYYEPNVDAALWFTKNVFPRIRSAKPTARLQLVGSQPTKAVERLARISGVEVTGSVPEVTPYLERATVFVAPIRIGGGFPNKVAEALAAGVPTVATPAAHAGIPSLIPGVHLMEAQGPKDFADETLALMADEPLRRQLSTAGRDFMAENYSWDRVIDSLEDVYTRCLIQR